MAFQFQKPLDVPSLQKRYEAKESRCSQKHVQKTQENSKRLQMSLGISRGASPPTQICDAPIVDLAYGDDANPRLGPRLDSEPLSINTTLDMASSDDFAIPTTPVNVDGHGPEPLAWDAGIPNECFDADLWPNPSLNQCEGAGMHDASDINARRADQNHRDHFDRLGPEEPALACLTPPLHEAANGLIAPTAPTQRCDDLVKDQGVVGVLVQSPHHALDLPSTLMTEGTASCVSSRAQSEGSTAAIEEPRGPSTSTMNAIADLIEARPPQNTAQVSGCGYPTPSSDSYQASEERAKYGSSGRKRTLHTAFDDTQAVKDAEDDVANIPDGRPQPKRQCDAAATSQNTSESCQRLFSSSASLTHISRGDNPQAMPRNSPIASIASPQSQHAHSTRPRGDLSSNRSQAVTPSVLGGTASLEANMTRILRNQACTSCGVNRTHLMRLSQNILRWADLPDSESVLTSGASLSTRERRAIMLRLAFGTLRDYLLEPLLEDEMELPADKRHSIPCTRMSSRTTQTPSLSTDVAAPCSDAEDSKNATSNATHRTKDSSHKLSRARIEEPPIENARKARKPRGRPPRPWSTEDEARLLEYLFQGMDWSDIATALKRSESGVQQHARIMGQKGKAWSPLDDRRLRAYMIEGMGRSEIAKKLKRSENDVILRWRTIPHG